MSCGFLKTLSSTGYSREPKKGFSQGPAKKSAANEELSPAKRLKKEDQHTDRNREGHIPQVVVGWLVGFYGMSTHWVILCRICFYLQTHIFFMNTIFFYKLNFFMNSCFDLFNP